MHEREWFDVRAACWRAGRRGCLGFAFLRNDGWETLICPWLGELEFDFDLSPEAAMPRRWHAARPPALRGREMLGRPQLREGLVVKN